MAAFVPMAQAQNSADEANNKAIVQRSFDAWAAGTGSPYDLLAEDAIWTIAGNSLASKTYPSRAAFIGEVIQPFVARMSVGLKPVIREIHADGSTVIVHFDAAGTAKDGKPYINTYAWFLDLSGGKIVKATAFYDSVAFNDLWTRVQPE
nr:nuclear transport factor 2 family protein [Mesorhizobium temperatum]